LSIPSTKFCSSGWHLGTIQAIFLMSTTMNYWKTIVSMFDFMQHFHLVEIKGTNLCLWDQQTGVVFLG
jgi:hypothetical protein